MQLQLQLLLSALWKGQRQQVQLLSVCLLKINCNFIAYNSIKWFGFLPFACPTTIRLLRTKTYPVIVCWWGRITKVTHKCSKKVSSTFQIRAEVSRRLTLLFTGYSMLVPHTTMLAFFFHFTQLTLSLRFLVIYCASHCLLLLRLLLSVFHLAIYLYACLPVRPYFCLSVCLSFVLSVCVSIVSAI